MSEKFGTSQPVRRREDVRLLTGRGEYVDDRDESGYLHAAFLRSPVAHGRIRSVDIDAALAAPGVVDVFTGADLKAAGLGGIHARPPLPGTEMDPPIHTPRPGMAADIVRHVGEPVAVVIAQTRRQAEDAVELVEADIEELPAVVEISDALADGAPAVWPDLAPDNVGLYWQKGDTEGADAAFAKAAHVTRLRLRNNRLVGNPMEPRTSLAEFDPESDCYTLTCASQGVHYMQEVLCEHVFDIPRDKMRVRTFDVGGGFGIKEQPYPEDVSILYAARRLGQPVKWQGTRSEHFISDNHARDAEIEAALALSEDGEFLAVRVSVDDAMGAYFACHGPFPSVRNMPNGLPLVYRTPIVDITTRLVMTNTVSIGPYRGAGREQASVIMERLVEQAARETGRDPIALRRRNYIQPGDMPYTTPAGRTYDVGEFEAVMEKAEKLSDAGGFAQRRTESERQGKIRGRGVASTVECVGAMPYEGAIIRFAEEGQLELTVATQSQGQGHETAFAQLINEHLGIPFENVGFKHGNSEDVPIGFATIGSRSMIMAGSAIANTCDRVIKKGRAWAGHLLEAAEADIEFSDGRFRVTGTDREFELRDLSKRVRAAVVAGDQPEDLPDTLDSEDEYRASEQFFPNGCHICEVEIESETGVVTIAQYAAIDDVGNVINPMIVHGQLDGGVAQGIGQALMEECRYDETGQLVTGSFMDYALPRATDIPVIDADFHPVPTPSNPLGVKGIGESGVVGAVPAVMNAIADALASRGATVDFDMPATSEKVWRALNQAS